MTNLDFDAMLYLSITSPDSEAYKKLNRKTKVVSAFPGCGKTYLHNSDKDFTTLDSDSSTFDKKDFPANYIKHIKENIGKVDVIFVSSHQEVRDALAEEDIAYYLIYPQDYKECKAAFLDRYKERGSPKSFIKLIGDNWGIFLKSLRTDKGSKQHIMLDRDEYIIEDLFY